MEQTSWVKENELRNLLIEKLEQYQRNDGSEPIKLDIDKALLQRLIFVDHRIVIPSGLWKLLDFNGVSFADVAVDGLDFTGSKGVVIIPSRVKDESLCCTILTDAEIAGSLDGVDMKYTDFTGSKGAVMDYDEVKYAMADNANLTDVTILEPSLFMEAEDIIKKSFPEKVKVKK